MIRLRIPITIDPRRLNLRGEILQPTDEVNATKNTRARFYVHGPRWFGWMHVGGEDRDYADQEVSIAHRYILIRKHDDLQVGWAIRYPRGESGRVYQIKTIDIPEEGDRQYMIALVEIRNTATVLEL